MFVPYANVASALNTAGNAADLGSGTAAGRLKFYSGTAPADADAALSGNTLLSTLVLSNPAFAAAVDTNPGASKTANAISDDTAAAATGTATFARVMDRDGNCVLQLTVTATGGGGEVTINSTAIQANTTVKCTSLVITLAEG